MREIKFRAWDEEIKCMVKVDSMHFPLGKPNKKDIAVFNEEEFYYEWVHDYKIMQYTGLKDKNGAEIYEGDIVKTCENRIQTVVWKNNGFKLKYTFQRAYQGESYFETSFFELRDTENRHWGDEIIGNIYENPELLEK